MSIVFLTSLRDRSHQFVTLPLHFYYHSYDIFPGYVNYWLMQNHFFSLSGIKLIHHILNYTWIDGM